MECPCCGRPCEIFPLENALKMLSPVSAEIVECLALSPGQYVLTDNVIAYVWRRNPDSQPENAAICVSAAIARNRVRLNAMGWDIEARRGQPGGYRLIVLKEAVA